MEHSLGEDSIPGSGSFDKSRVLNVKPLRSLVPVFPSAPNGSSFSTPQGGAPFFCATPSGPFPNGASPFFPFFTSDSQRPPEQNTSAAANQSGPFGFSNPISNAIPINSFRTPTPTRAGRAQQHTGVANGDTGSGSSRRLTRSRAQTEDGYSENQNQVSEYYGTDGTEVEERGKVGRPKRKAQKRTSGGGGKHANVPSDADIDMVVDKIQTSFNDKFGQTEGDRASVEYLTMMYDLFRRRVLQADDLKDAVPGLSRRPDLRAGTLFLNKGIRANSKKRIGTVPGVEVGDIFFFRMELCLVGLHAPSMAGIDYMGIKNTGEEEPLAVSIVSSGGYEDYAEDPDVLIYSGQGGVNRRDKELSDQKLERGNLALEKSTHRANDVRVIRGVKDLSTVSGKIYVYDGLYRINESWTEKAKNGCSVFKYKLVRMPGQPEAFRIWKSIEQWKGGATSRVGVILPDLTSGEEKLPVSLVNDVDDEKGPAHFTYTSSLKYSNPINSTVPSSGCVCIGGCLSGNSNCPCLEKNKGSLPYTANGLIVSQKSLLHECGASCQCPPICKNRVSQSGLKFHLEVFKTKDRGWGLRSWDPIRAGAFICEYAGEVISPSKIDKFGVDTDDDYTFDATRNSQPLGVLPGEPDEAPKIPFPLVISAKYAGNVARFMNHSCSPNVLWQPISRENKNESDIHIAFYAVRHIPPMTELTYDYGIISQDDADQRKKKCLCGSSRCRGFFYQ